MGGCTTKPVYEESHVLTSAKAEDISFDLFKTSMPGSKPGVWLTQMSLFLVYSYWTTVVLVLGKKAPKVLLTPRTNS